MSQVSHEGRGPGAVAHACVLTLLASLAMGVLCPVGRVAACSMASVTYAIDPGLRGDDSEAPAPFSNPSAFTRRISATYCDGTKCTQSSCGDRGQLELQFDAREDAAGSDAVGFRIVWLSGELSDEARRALDGARQLFEPGRVTIDLGWSDVTQLSGEIALVAVDHAGNESAPSDAVRVEWSGCTSSWDDPTCRPATTNQVVGGAANGCAISTLAPTSGPGSLGLWLWVAGLVVACVRCKRARVPTDSANDYRTAIVSGHILPPIAATTCSNSPNTQVCVPQGCTRYSAGRGGVEISGKHGASRQLARARRRDSSGSVARASDLHSRGLQLRS